MLEHSSLDAYLYLRFLRTTIFICFVGVCITWPILFPVNATGGGHASQLDRLGFGNVHDNHRLYAHAVVACVFFSFVMFVIVRERIWLVGLRQAWYLSRANASRLSSRTVLYLDPPKEASADADAQSTFGTDARRQWVVTGTKPLDDLVESRHDKAMRLEYAEVSFLRQASKKIAKTGRTDPDERDLESARPRERAYYVAGAASDLIKHLRGEVKEAAGKVDDTRKSYTAQRTGGHSRCAIFVEYEDQSSAQRAYRGESNKLHIPVPANMAVQSRLIGVVPNELVWRNLAMPQAERLSKKSAANLFIIALIIFWSIPTAIVGTISNVNYLASFEWLNWLNNLPAPIIGLLTGFLPPLLTSLLASYVPNLMRREYPAMISLSFLLGRASSKLISVSALTDVAKISGEPTTVTAELQVQAWYYIFQLVQVFLVTALSSSATAFIPKIINEPHHVPQLLADNIPKSSNFYLTYFIVQGLGSSVKAIMNWSDLFWYIFFDLFVYKTPRDKFNHYTSLKSIGWGKVYPKFTNFIIIALVYSCISPLVLGFATVGLLLFYFAYKYNLLFVIQPKIESKGKCYTRALQQILAGVYIGELCLIGLFGLRKAKGPGILLLILFIGTIVYHVLTNRYLRPLEDHLPTRLLSQGSSDPEEQPLLAAAESGAPGGDDEAADRDSRIQQIGREIHVPRELTGPIARFFEPHVYASRKAMRAFLQNTAAETDPEPQYSDEQLQSAYENPSLRSKTPVLWLPRDTTGLSKREIDELKQVEIEATDEGAWVDAKGKVYFERHQMKTLPVWKQAPPY